MYSASYALFTFYFLLFTFYLDSVWGVYGNGNGQSEAFNLKTTSPLGTPPSRRRALNK